MPMAARGATLWATPTTRVAVPVWRERRRPEAHSALVAPLTQGGHRAATGRLAAAAWAAPAAAEMVVRAVAAEAAITAAVLAGAVASRLVTRRVAAAVAAAHASRSP